MLLAEMIELGGIEFGSLSFMDGHWLTTPTCKGFLGLGLTFRVSLTLSWCAYTRQHRILRATFAGGFFQTGSAAVAPIGSGHTAAACSRRGPFDSRTAARRTRGRYLRQRRPRSRPTAHGVPRRRQSRQHPDSRRSLFRFRPDKGSAPPK